MALKKTRHVGELIDMANHFLLNTADEAKGERLGVASFLESILHQADAYKGFNYLSADQMSKSFRGKSVGVVWTGGEPGIGKPEFPDQSRRMYHVDRRLLLGRKISLG